MKGKMILMALASLVGAQVVSVAVAQDDGIYYSRKNARKAVYQQTASDTWETHANDDWDVDGYNRRVNVADTVAPGVGSGVGEGYATQGGTTTPPSGLYYYDATKGKISAVEVDTLYVVEPYTYSDRIRRFHNPLFGYWAYSPWYDIAYYDPFYWDYCYWDPWWYCTPGFGFRWGSWYWGWDYGYYGGWYGGWYAPYYHHQPHYFGPEWAHRGGLNPRFGREGARGYRNNMGGHFSVHDRSSLGLRGRRATADGRGVVVGGGVGRTAGSRAAGRGIGVAGRDNDTRATSLRGSLPSATHQQQRSNMRQQPAQTAAQAQQRQALGGGRSTYGLQSSGRATAGSGQSAQSAQSRAQSASAGPSRSGSTSARQGSVGSSTSGNRYGSTGTGQSTSRSQAGGRSTYDNSQQRRSSVTGRSSSSSSASPSRQSSSAGRSSGSYSSPTRSSSSSSSNSYTPSRSSSYSGSSRSSGSLGGGGSYGGSSSRGGGGGGGSRGGGGGRR